MLRRVLELVSTPGHKFYRRSRLLCENVAKQVEESVPEFQALAPTLIEALRAELYQAAEELANSMGHRLLIVHGVLMVLDPGDDDEDGDGQ